MKRPMHFFLLLFATAVAMPAIAQPSFIEIRRTLASPHCDSGELYVDGVLLALFQSDPALFAAPDAATGVLVGKLSTTLYNPPGVFTEPKQAFEFKAPDGSVKLHLAMLNADSYTPFVRRQRTRRLGPTLIVLGFSVIDRKCRVAASSDEPSLMYTSNRMGDAILGVSNLKNNFPSALTKDAIVVLTDRAHSLEISFGGHKFVETLPVSGAEAVAAGHNCLLKHEHMSNTIHRPSGVTYERRDDVVVCPTGTFGAIGAIEMLRDIRHITFQDQAICSTPFGIPINRYWQIWRGTADAAGPVWDNCSGTLNQGEWKKTFDTATITMR